MGNYGGGNGVQTMEGHLGILGEKVRLYKRSQQGGDKINETREIILHHAVEGVGKIEFATSSSAEAIDGADIIMLILPSNTHEQVAKEMIPHLVDGQMGLIHPEESCGALQFRHIMNQMRCTKHVVVGSTSTLLYAT